MSVNYLYILATVLCTVYSQLVLKWRISLYHDTSVQLSDKLSFIGRLLLDPYILTGLAAAFIAALFWMMALTKFELSFAYPFTSLSFVLVVLFSAWLFHESLTGYKLGGLGFILVGIIIISRSL
ncbi:MAG: hypothetical protein ACD_43C00217G0003 [uncultured bacterium]|nr:MAG: hypothetical protein ACD_43C00217G0003 [uncultured bacterium]